jgi:cytochrome c biogenesis protein CcmG, thiol:disulfide interchange protein DsbE
MRAGRLHESGLILLVAALACGCASARPLPDAATLSVLQAQTLEGRTLRLGELRGKVVLLDFWATWCVPCRESLPFYAELQRELGARGLQVVAVSVDSSTEPVRSYFGTASPPFLVVRDPDGGGLADRLGVRVMPTSFLVDRSGAARFRQEGFSSGDRESLRARILSLLVQE